MFKTVSVPPKTTATSATATEGQEIPAHDTNTDSTVLLDTNPKTVFGAAKPSLCLVPSSGLVHEAMAFADGAEKYGAYNWREKAVSAMTYLHAAERHIRQYLDREQYDAKSGVHHLGHAKACLAIILDAELCNNLIDDRPTPADITILLARYTKPLE